MEQAEAESYITHGAEERNLEYKESLNWSDPATRAKITKAVLGMTNIRDGGVVAIGVEQQGDAFAPKGMLDADFESFQQDAVSDHIAEYADPFVELTVTRCEYNSGKYVIIQVKEFEELPVICKRDGQENLRRGVIYTRSRRKPETILVPTQTEMREIIELAVDIGIRKQSERLGRAGFQLGQIPSPEEASRQAFDEQLDIMTLTTKSQEILDKIHQRGYWRVVIRPTQFKTDRLDLKDCKQIVASSAVHLRGWDYPHVTSAEITRGSDWIESSCDGTSKGLPHIEHWRFFQSGQFVHHLACHEDYRQPYNITPSELLKTGEPYLLGLSTLFTVTEIFEFAAQLTRRDVLLPGAELSIKLFGMQNRWLAFAADRMFFDRCQSALEEIVYPVKTVSSAELLARAPELALEAAEWIFERFGANLSRELLAQEQQRFLQRNL